MKTKKQKIMYITQIAIFTALSVLLYFIRIPLPIFPSFLKVQFSALPIAICGFALGPVSGMVVLICKTLICLPMTESMYVGDFADFIIGSGYVIITSMIYKQNKTKKGAIISLAVGTGTWVILGAIANYLILVPFYISVFLRNNVSGFVDMCSIVPLINESNYRIIYVLFAAVPFNLLLSSTVSLVTFFVYKKVSSLIKLGHED